MWPFTKGAETNFEHLEDKDEYVNVFYAYLSGFLKCLKDVGEGVGRVQNKMENVLFQSQNKPAFWWNTHTKQLKCSVFMQEKKRNVSSILSTENSGNSEQAPQPHVHVLPSFVSLWCKRLEKGIFKKCLGK